MKKVLTITGSVIVSLIITFVLSELFSLYHFGSVSTPLTIIYLISLFSIFEYLILAFCYIFNKKKNKEIITRNNIISIILFFVSLLLVLYFIFATDVDWLNYYSKVNSAPFYLTVIKNGIMILLPSVVLFILGIVILKKKK